MYICLYNLWRPVIGMQVSSGRLLAVVSGHYQPVSVLKFTDDGRWLISGGEDGRVLVWSLKR